MDNNQKKVQNRKTRKKKKFKPWKVVLLVIVLMFLVVLGAGTGVVLAYINTAPEIDTDIFTENLKLTTNIYDKDGNYIESLHGNQNRTYVPLSKIPKYTQDAFIAIEDERFYKHFGVDVRRILGALWADVKSGSLEQGASTITQQLIKNVMLSPEKLWKRKIQEAYLSIKLERLLSKDQILEYYLNTINLGGSAHGVQAAAEYYFNKNVEDLTIAESALIAGITKWPSKYNPYLNKNTPEVYKQRQLTVLSKMLENNMISEEEYEKAKNEELVFEKKNDNTTLKYQWFIEASVDSIAKDLKEKYNYSTDEVNQLLYSGGLRIYTTIDTKIQEIVEKEVNNDQYYPDLKKDLATWGPDNTIQPQTAVVITDYKTGQVRAVVGGRGSQPLRSQNRATDPTYARQPGSSMKPIAVYGPAFDLGYSPASVVDDAPFTPEMKAAADNWDPKNVDHKYRGLTTLREAVRISLNVVAGKLVMDIGPSTSTEYIKKFGISTLVESGKQNDAGPSKALGALTKGVTPLEMSSAYGVFGNNGVYVEPILYTKVLDSKGKVLLEKTQESHQVISPQAAYLTVDVMKDVVTSGTGTSVRSKNRGNFTSMPSAGKTGTTQYGVDVYFAGLTPYYSGAIWMGHDNPSADVSFSSSTPAWIWGSIMRQIHEGLESKDFANPGGIVTAKVCRDSGKLATELCENDPRGSRVITEKFIQGTVPTETCDVHVTAIVDTSTGKLANEFCPVDLVKEQVFIKKPIPTTNESVQDYKYQVPTEICDVHNESTVTPTPTPTLTPTKPSEPSQSSGSESDSSSNSESGSNSSEQSSGNSGSASESKGTSSSGENSHNNEKTKQSQ